MSTCDELRPWAAGVAALAPGDPEREQYLAHARGCPGCMQALREGEKVFALLGEVKQRAPSEAALRQASAAIVAELAQAGKARTGDALPARRRTQARAVLLPGVARAAAVLLAFAVPVLFAHHRDAEGWTAALLVTGLAALLAASAGALRSGALVAVAAAAGFAFAAGGVPGFATGESAAGLASKVGAECFTMELLVALLPFSAAAFWYRRDPRPGALAQAAAAGALAGQAALHLACPAHTQAAHLWVFHVGGVALAALLGFLAEAQLKTAPT